jgi:transketolase C-terminal domain/subunit
VTATAVVETTYREAVREALRDAMRRDDRVFLMGEDVGRYGGCFAVSLGLLEEFGPDRVRDTPLSELAFVGAGIGAALAGMRPVVEIMTVNFSLLALDQILNNAATKASRTRLIARAARGPSEGLPGTLASSTCRQEHGQPRTWAAMTSAIARVRASKSR